MLSWEYIFSREHFNINHRQFGISPSMSKRLPGALKENTISLKETDKVFASEWISEQYVTFGTKCSKVGCKTLLVLVLIVSQCKRLYFDCIFYSFSFWK